MSLEKNHNNYKENKNWFRLNNFDTNQDYAEKILKKFNLQKYHFAYDKYGSLSLLVEQNLKKYKVVVDEAEMVVKIYRCDVHTSFGKYTKENMTLKKKFSNDCIYNSIKWISKNSQL